MHKSGTPLSANGNWWAWGDTHLASLFGTQAQATGADPAEAAWRGLFSSPEPYPLEATRAAGGDLSPRESCVEECNRKSPLCRFPLLPCPCIVKCRQESGRGPGGDVASCGFGLLPAWLCDPRQMALWAAGIALLVIGARELIQG